MVASREMRATRDLPLAVSLALTASAVFFGGGPGNGSLPWLGGVALLAIVVLLVTRGVPSGWQALVPLAVLTCWIAIPIVGAGLPHPPWDARDPRFLDL